MHTAAPSPRGPIHFLLIAQLFLPIPVHAAQLLHPETVYPSLVKPGFSLSIDAGGSASFRTVASARFTWSSTLVYRDGSHLGGLVSAYTYEWDGSQRVRNEGTLDLRYYALFGTRFHFEAFFAGAFNEPARMDYLLLGGPGLGVLLAGQKPFLCQAGFVLPVGGLRQAGAAQVGLGVFPYTGFTWDLLKRLSFDGQLYAQCLWVQGAFVFSLPFHARLEWSLTERLRIGLSYLFLWDAASTGLPFTHDLNLGLRVRL